MNRACWNNPYIIRTSGRSSSRSGGCFTGSPSSSTFHGAKCSNGVKAVPHSALVPSDTTHATLQRNASGSSFAYVASWFLAYFRSSLSSPAFFSSTKPSGIPLT